MGEDGSSTGRFVLLRRWHNDVLMVKRSWGDYERPSRAGDTRSRAAPLPRFPTVLRGEEGRAGFRTDEPGNGKVVVWAVHTFVHEYPTLESWLSQARRPDGQRGTGGEMGGHPYWYFVPYQQNLQQALDDLRAAEPHIWPILSVIPSSSSPSLPSPRRTRGRSTRPSRPRWRRPKQTGPARFWTCPASARHPEYCVAAPPPAKLTELYGHGASTHEMLESSRDFIEVVRARQVRLRDRLSGSDPGQSSFGGYSYD